MNEPTQADYVAYLGRTNRPVPTLALTGAVTGGKPGKLRTFTRDEFRAAGRAIWADCDRERREALLDARGDLEDMLRGEAWDRKMATTMLAMDLNDGEDLDDGELERIYRVPTQHFI